MVKITVRAATSWELKRMEKYARFAFANPHLAEGGAPATAVARALGMRLGVVERDLGLLNVGKPAIMSYPDPATVKHIGLYGSANHTSLRAADGSLIDIRAPALFTAPDAIPRSGSGGMAPGAASIWRPLPAALEGAAPCR